jgi:hypothetical protein
MAIWAVSKMRPLVPVQDREKPMKIRAVLVLSLALAGSANAQTLDDAVRMLNAGRAQEAKPVLLAIAAREPENARAQHYAGRVLLTLDPKNTQAQESLKKVR